MLKKRPWLIDCAIRDPMDALGGERRSRSVLQKNSPNGVKMSLKDKIKEETAEILGKAKGAVEQEAQDLIEQAEQQVTSEVEELKEQASDVVSQKTDELMKKGTDALKEKA